MKIPQTLKTATAQHSFEASLVIILLLILGRNGAAIAMMVGSVIGLIAYLGLYGERLCSRGQLKRVALVVALSFVLGTAAAAALWLIRLRWQ
jgi:hypothetical protein